MILARNRHPHPHNESRIRVRRMRCFKRTPFRTEHNRLQFAGNPKLFACVGAGVASLCDGHCCSSEADLCTRCKAWFQRRLLSRTQSVFPDSRVVLFLGAAGGHRGAACQIRRKACKTWSCWRSCFFAASTAASSAAGCHPAHTSGRPLVY